MGYKGRDVEVNMLDAGICLVTACDSCGAIGDKPLDQLKVPPQLVGQLTARVALMEILCTGARPRVMTAAISSEPHPTGAAIVDGIRKELTLAGFPHINLAISTEKNFAPDQTGLGIGVTGTCSREALRIGTSRPGDRVYCLGLPRVGEAVANAKAEEIIGTAQIQELLAMEGLGEILPVGSRGIGAEAQSLAHGVGTRFQPDPPTKASPQPDFTQSAGPSTCAIFTSNRPLTRTAMAALPLVQVGTLI
ncbi:MAG: hypothetical protein MI747_07225 [Desulfobacterales bacterium]|nr:hypothetical protein [Desulfobacterales bacterium]